DRALDELDRSVAEADVDAPRVPGRCGDHARDARPRPWLDISVPARPMVGRRGVAVGELVFDPPVALPGVHLDRTRLIALLGDDQGLIGRAGVLSDGNRVIEIVDLAESVLAVLRPPSDPPGLKAV